MTDRRRTFAVIVGLTLAGQLCAVAYEMAVASRFGTGPEADALALALTLVLAVANEVVTWITALFIPSYIDAEASEGSGTAQRFLRLSLRVIVIATAVAGVALAAGAGPMVGLLAPALSTSLAPVLLRLFAPLLTLLPLAALLTSALQARGRFILPSVRYLCWYGVALATVVVGGHRLGASAVPVGMVTGLTLFGLILAVGLASEPRAAPAGASVGPRLRRVGGTLLPLALASALNYGNVSLERALAARLPEGSLAALTYASRLLNSPFNLLLLNATTILFPLLSEHAARGQREALLALVQRAVRLALLFSVPLSALAIALAEPAVRLLLERNAFTADSTRLTAVAVAWYAPALVGMAGVQVLARTYQALHAIRRMVAAGVTAVAVNFAVMPLLTRWLGLPGLPLALSLNAILLLTIMLVALRPVLPGLDLAGIAGSALRALLAGAVALVAARLAAEGPWPGDIGVLAAGALAGFGAYALALLGLSKEDGRLVVAFLRPRRSA